MLDSQGPKALFIPRGRVAPQSRGYRRSKAAAGGGPAQELRSEGGHSPPSTPNGKRYLQRYSNSTVSCQGQEKAPTLIVYGSQGGA
jgi:hypothetical protein